MGVSSTSREAAMVKKNCHHIDFAIYILSFIGGVYEDI